MASIPTIMVIDDDVNIVKTLDMMLRQAGYRVEARHDFLPVQIFRVFTPDPDAS